MENPLVNNLKLKIMTKTAIVTGASTGIGREVAKLFISKGFNVVMTSFSKENLLETYNSFGAPPNAMIVAGDISLRETREELLHKTLSNFGRIDILVNNAGVFQPKPFLEVEEKDIDRFYSINLKGTYFMTQVVLEPMIANGGGAILNIGSVLVDHAVSGLPTTAPISIKGAIHSFTRQLAAEFGKNKIRVNAIAPGVIRTALQGKMGVTDPDSYANLSVLNKIGEPVHIARMAYELVTNDFITGEVVNVDGGHVVAR
jgi:NAD(P)-dependent dehydrogenase (short-subunit alcohol dehydrogenase family)